MGAPRPHKAVSVPSAVGLGVGAMVGAGIFALLGEAGSIAGAGVWISFIAGGLIALLSGDSMARLGARYPAAGGIVEYLAQAGPFGQVQRDAGRGPPKLASQIAVVANDTREGGSEVGEEGDDVGVDPEHGIFPQSRAGDV